jgi:YVTN family beta-propeller protein
MTHVAPGDYECMQDTIGELIREHGLIILRRPDQFRGALADAGRAWPQPYRAVVAAVDAGALATLTEGRPVTEAEVHQLSAKVTEHGCSGAEADWAVRTLAAAGDVQIVPIGEGPAFGDPTGNPSVPTMRTAPEASRPPTDHVWGTTTTGITTTGTAYEGPPRPGPYQPAADPYGPTSHPNHQQAPGPFVPGQYGPFAPGGYGPGGPAGPYGPTTLTGPGSRPKRTGLLITVAVVAVLALLTGAAFLISTLSSEKPADGTRATSTPQAPPALAPARVLSSIKVADKSPSAVAISPNGNTLYVMNAGYNTDPGNTVSAVDPRTNTVTATYSTGAMPNGAAITPDGRRVYVFATVSNTVSVIDTATGSVISTVPVGVGPSDAVITPDGKHAYVADTGLSVIDTATNTVTATISDIPAPWDVAVSPDGTRVYAATRSSAAGPGGVTVVDTATNAVIGTVDAGTDPTDVSLSPDGRRIYVVARTGDNLPGRVSVVDTESRTILATITTGGNPADLVVSPDNRRAYVTNGGTLDTPGTTVTVIDTLTNTVSNTLTVGEGPAGLAVSPDSKRVYVANFQSGTLSIIDTGVK